MSLETKLNLYKIRFNTDFDFEKHIVAFGLKRRMSSSFSHYLTP